ncbi:MAG: primosomal protein N' [Candidatus Omnitrophica bacterium]|nr:primosomal protein N' [Candidatus Omnitrophota bacterium]
MNEPRKFAEVAVGLPVQSTFHYRVPARFQSRIGVGQRVMVPFGHRRLLGVIVDFVARPEVAAVKPIDTVLDNEAVLEPDLLQLTRWMGRHYQVGWGETIQTALPVPFRRGQSDTKPREEEEPAPLVPHEPPRLTAAQRAVLEPIQKAIETGEHQIFLLHGVTGSGKTEVYLQAIRTALEKNLSSIVLVPEISLTPQTIERFQGRFGRKEVALLHSGMLESRRLQEWKRIRSGEARVVVGARSAVFAPIRSLGLIVVDEEHEPSYKQDDSPRYHAREVAIQRAVLNKAVVLLGSATPSLESYEKAQRGEIRLLELKERVEEIPLPAIDIVDMRQEIPRGRHSFIFSRKLEEAIAKTLEEKQQAILFLNRRGFSTFAQCRKCGHTMRCRSCQIALTYHIETKEMICHYCTAAVPAPELCPQCRSGYLRFFGTGTQRVESELAKNFPHARIARMDTDATRVRGSHEKILGAFRRGETDILIGTQMVAKGLDYPRVTLVGVISADTALNLPDFRSAERTFNLLTQVAGRAGRSHLAGRVIVQTYAPHHYAIQAASRHDYRAFYNQEIQVRKELNLPPFSRLIQLVSRSPSAPKGLAFAEKAAQELRKHLQGQPVEIVGPSPAPIHKLRRQVRWQILIKTAVSDKIEMTVGEALKRLHPPKGCHLAVDVDPL